MAYIPPANNAVNFGLVVYTAPANNAVDFSFSQIQSVSVTQVTESNIVQTISKLKRKALNAATESELANPIGRVKTVNISQAIETDEVFIIELLEQTILASASEVDTANPITRIKIKSVCPQSSYEIFIEPVSGAVKYLFFLEKKTAEPYHLIDDMDYLDDARNWKIGESASPTFSILLPDDGSEYAAGIVAENGVGVYSGMQVNVFNTESFIVTETDLSQSIQVIKRHAILQVTESEAANAITRSKRITIAQVVESDFSASIVAAKQVEIGQAEETDRANYLNVPGRLTQINEVDTALQITAAKLVLLSAAEETGFALQLNRVLKQNQILPASEIDEAGLMSNKTILFKALEQVVEVNEAGKIIYRNSPLPNYENEDISSELSENTITAEMSESLISVELSGNKCAGILTQNEITSEISYESYL